MDFKPVELFGGALAVELPPTFADVRQVSHIPRPADLTNQSHSTIREIPDHQEVYLDSHGYTNVIFEILERVGADIAPTDEDALKYHLHDIVSTETDETKFWGGGTASFTKLPYILHSYHIQRNY